MEIFSWNRYTKKMHEFLKRPLSIGTFGKEPAGMICLTAESGSKEEGNWFHIQVIVDTLDGVIADSKFLFFGPTILLVALEAVSRFMVRKNIKQAKKITPEILDRFLRDQESIAALNEKQTPYFLFVIEGVLEALAKAPEIQVSEYSTPLERIEMHSLETMREDWDELTDAQRLQILENVFEEHVRPFLAMDEGGVQILGLENKTQVKIAYSGNCTSCFSAIGGTLQGIQNVLNERIHPKLIVVPDLENLHLG
ncbi:MAG: hypothetical protein FJZ62_02600 [Chlamydiae bacterium]|nr:hypothetical protein [Chlamydiota bacterium]